MKSGKPYLSVEKTCGGPGGSLVTTYQQKTLSWNSFTQYTAHISDELRDYYTGISESNWQDYLNPKYDFNKILEKRDEYSDICDMIDKYGGHYAKQNKPDIVTVCFHLRVEP